MNRTPRKIISVFIASPGDLAPERKAFKDTVDSLNKGFGDGVGVLFEAIGWEDANSEAGRRVQDVLNAKIAKSDLFVLVLHRRWGQQAPDSSYSSYTEEEFRVAMDLWKRTKSPEVIVLFKTVDSASIADPGPQLAQVLSFKKQLEESRNILYRSFNSDVDFVEEIDRHLRSFARGEWQRMDDQLSPVTFSQEIIGQFDKASQANEARVQKAEKDQQQLETAASSTAQNLKTASADLTLVKAYLREFALARAAMDAAGNHRIEDARILFAQATEGTTDLSILSAAAEFFRQVNDPENASRLVQRQATIARDRTIAAEHYLKLMPAGFASSLMDQMLQPIVDSCSPDIQQEVRDIFFEIYGDGKLDRLIIDVMVHFYSVEEIVQLATFLASPVGQSSLRKQADIQRAMVEYGKQEFQRVLRERHPDWVDGAAPMQDGDGATMPPALPQAPLQVAPAHD
jgi:hypothetical protein